MMEQTFRYDFSEDEIKALVLLLRENEATLPGCLENLMLNLQNCIYDSMTIDEAEKFFNESI
ncbi:MAG: hypothetical protein J5747_10500 [Spirochaetaceae bacterium]|nr:hypothetical protein [Spirochaetaceae bacterium]MBO4704902.1 hypothetical protein [Spirochaetaceae bacterium]